MSLHCEIHTSCEEHRPSLIPDAGAPAIGKRGQPIKVGPVPRGGPCRGTLGPITGVAALATLATPWGDTLGGGSPFGCACRCKTSWDPRLPGQIPGRTPSSLGACRADEDRLVP